MHTTQSPYARPSSALTRTKFGWVALAPSGVETAFSAASHSRPQSAAQPRTRPGSSSQRTRPQSASAASAGAPSAKPSRPPVLAAVGTRSQHIGDPRRIAAERAARLHDDENAEDDYDRGDGIAALRASAEYLRPLVVGSEASQRAMFVRSWTAADVYARLSEDRFFKDTMVRRPDLSVSDSALRSPRTPAETRARADAEIAAVRTGPSAVAELRRRAQDEQQAAEKGYHYAQASPWAEPSDGRPDRDESDVRLVPLVDALHMHRIDGSSLLELTQSDVSAVLGIRQLGVAKATLRRIQALADPSTPLPGDPRPIDLEPPISHAMRVTPAVLPAVQRPTSASSLMSASSRATSPGGMGIAASRPQSAAGHYGGMYHPDRIGGSRPATAGDRINRAVAAVNRPGSALDRAAQQRTLSSRGGQARPHTAGAAKPPLRVPPRVQSAAAEARRELRGEIRQLRELQGRDPSDDEGHDHSDHSGHGHGDGVEFTDADAAPTTVSSRPPSGASARRDPLTAAVERAGEVEPPALRSEGLVRHAAVGIDVARRLSEIQEYVGELTPDAARARAVVLEQLEAERRERAVALQHLQHGHPVAISRPGTAPVRSPARALGLGPEVSPIRAGDPDPEHPTPAPAVVVPPLKTAHVASSPPRALGVGEWADDADAFAPSDGERDLADDAPRRPTAALGDGSGSDGEAPLREDGRQCPHGIWGVAEDPDDGDLSSSIARRRPPHTPTKGTEEDISKGDLAKPPHRQLSPEQLRSASEAAADPGPPSPALPFVPGILELERRRERLAVAFGAVSAGTDAVTPAWLAATVGAGLGWSTAAMSRRGLRWAEAIAARRKWHRAQQRLARGKRGQAGAGRHPHRHAAGDEDDEDTAEASPASPASGRGSPRSPRNAALIGSLAMTVAAPSTRTESGALSPRSTTVPHEVGLTCAEFTVVLQRALQRSPPGRFAAAIKALEDAFGPAHIERIRRRRLARALFLRWDYRGVGELPASVVLAVQAAFNDTEPVADLQLAAVERLDTSGRGRLSALAGPDASAEGLDETERRRNDGDGSHAAPTVRVAVCSAEEWRRQRRGEPDGPGRRRSSVASATDLAADAPLPPEATLTAADLEHVVADCFGSLDPDAFDDTLLRLRLCVEDTVADARGFGPFRLGPAELLDVWLPKTHPRRAAVILYSSTADPTAVIEAVFATQRDAGRIDDAGAAPVAASGSDGDAAVAGSARRPTRRFSYTRDGDVDSPSLPPRKAEADPAGDPDAVWRRAGNVHPSATAPRPPPGQQQLRIFLIASDTSEAAALDALQQHGIRDGEWLYFIFPHVAARGAVHPPRTHPALQRTLDRMEAEDSAHPRGPSKEERNGALIVHRGSDGGESEESEEAEVEEVAPDAMLAFMRRVGLVLATARVPPPKTFRLFVHCPVDFVSDDAVPPLLASRALVLPVLRLETAHGAQARVAARTITARSPEPRTPEPSPARRGTVASPPASPARDDRGRSKSTTAADSGDVEDQVRPPTPTPHALSPARVHVEGAPHHASRQQQAVELLQAEAQEGGGQAAVMDRYYERRAVMDAQGGTAAEAAEEARAALQEEAARIAGEEQRQREAGQRLEQERARLDEERRRFDEVIARGRSAEPRRDGDVHPADGAAAGDHQSESAHEDHEPPEAAAAAEEQLEVQREEAAETEAATQPAEEEPAAQPEPTAQPTDADAAAEENPSGDDSDTVSGLQSPSAASSQGGDDRGADAAVAQEDPVDAAADSGQPPPRAVDSAAAQEDTEAVGSARSGDADGPTGVEGSGAAATPSRSSADGVETEDAPPPAATALEVSPDRHAPAAADVDEGEGEGTPRDQAAGAPVRRRSSAAWCAAGMRASASDDGLAEVDGAKVTKAECYAAAVAEDPSNGPAWYNLGCAIDGGGAVMEGVDPAASHPLRRASLPPGDAPPRPAAPQPVPQLGGARRLSLPDGLRATSGDDFGDGNGSEATQEGGVLLSKQLCYIQALECDADDSEAWNNLGATLHDPFETVAALGAPRTRRECFTRACASRPTNKTAWRNLGATFDEGFSPSKSQQRVTVGGLSVTQDMCLAVGRGDTTYSELLVDSAMQPAA